MVESNCRVQQTQRSHLFMVRLWLEEIGDGQTDWRGSVQHINSREARYFRDWPTLETFLEDLLHRHDPEELSPGGIEECLEKDRGL